jgi:hypothetical protein
MYEKQRHLRPLFLPRLSELDIVATPTFEPVRKDVIHFQPNGWKYFSFVIAAEVSQFVDLSRRIASLRIRLGRLKVEVGRARFLWAWVWLGLHTLALFFGVLKTLLNKSGLPKSLSGLGFTK